MTLVLAMIVRDEAHAVAATMASALPFVDEWLIADTGSVDRTVDAIVRTAVEHRKPGKIVRVRFENFAQARNAVLDAIEPGKVALWLDAEDQLINGGSLRSWLEIAPGNCWSLEHQWSDGQRFTRPTVVRAGTGWRFHGRVHEVLKHSTERSVGLVGPSIYQTRTPANDAATFARQEWDVAQLRAQIADEPHDPRWPEYLARTQRVMARRSATAQATDGD